MDIIWGFDEFGMSLKNQQSDCQESLNIMKNETQEVDMWEIKVVEVSVN